jgi:hypothetical protein
MVPYQAAHDTSHQEGHDHTGMVPSRWRRGPCRTAVTSAKTTATVLLLLAVINRGLGGPGQVSRNGKQDQAAAGVRRGQVNHAVRHGLEECTRDKHGFRGRCGRPYRRQHVGSDEARANPRTHGPHDAQGDHWHGRWCQGR